jgi:hypothetical protein
LIVPAFASLERAPNGIDHDRRTTTSFAPTHTWSDSA